ncbi:MAG: NUDIX hydrolase [Candidatus Sericytochromatia bacterium]|nr:NUDIX hydrolase [Candidatus Sericytochromatia bacterium]
MPRHTPDQPPDTQPTAPLPAAFLHAAVTVDLVVFTILDADLKILLIQRREPPFVGHWALPGGFLRSDGGLGEDLDAAARRELQEETGLPPAGMYLAQLGTYGKPDRDPRGRVVSVAYFALVRPDLAPFVAAGGDAANATWHSVSELARLSLAFDHAAMIAAAQARLRQELDTTGIAFELVPATFTTPELRAVHDVIKGIPSDPGNFRRKFQAMITDGLIEQAPGKRITGGKPAMVYRFRQQPTESS